MQTGRGRKNGMRKECFHEGWVYRHLDGSDAWRPVRLPHDAMLCEPRTADAPGGRHTGWFEGQDYQYQKVFTLPPCVKNAWIEFEGVYRNAQVYFDGIFAARHRYGYTGFFVDVSQYFPSCIDHVLSVNAYNAKQPNSRWYSGAGLFRPVTLWTAGAAYIAPNGIRVTTLSVDPCRIRVNVKTSAPGQVQIHILQKEEEVAFCTAQSDGEAVADMTIPGGKTWSPSQPALYTCRADFRDDSASTQFGMRLLRWGENGLSINGERTVLRGACIHHDNGPLGACSYPDAEERKVRILQANGYNAIRSAHIPCAKALLDACDRLGMLVLDEYADQWYIRKTKYDYAGELPFFWREDLRSLVDKDYNHPSVILYSIGNEVSETAQARGILFTEEMARCLHALDPSRPVTCGINLFFNFLSSFGLGVYSDQKAMRQQAPAGLSGSEMYNRLAGLLGSHTMKLGALLPGCDRKTRAAYASLDIAGYNYGIKRCRSDLKKYPSRLILGTETFCSDAWRFTELAKENPRLIGDFVWTGMDYLGEVGLGAWEYPEDAPAVHQTGWLTAGAGRIDLTGRPLGEALYTRVALGAESGPYLAVRPVCYCGEKHTPAAWRMTDAIDSWSWQGCEGKLAEIEVYARCHRVALWLNGEQIATKKMNRRCRITFRCRYRPGKLEAAAYDRLGRETGRTALQTAQEETLLSVCPETKRTAAGHLVFVRLRYTDPLGIVKPMQRGLVRVCLTGGTLLGIGNGCAYQPEGFQRDAVRTYHGEALAILRADAPETLTIAATDGLRSAEAVIAVTK